jgi:hypothetical protein
MPDKDNPDDTTEPVPQTPPKPAPPQDIDIKSGFDPKERRLIIEGEGKEKK